jgi:hypothetical protein
MLLIHEVHHVAGAHEDDFDARMRDDWMPAVAKDDSARLLWFLNHAHGTGRAYSVVTVTAVADGAAYERFTNRVQTGDLRSLALEIDGLRHRVDGKLLLQVPWSPFLDLDLATVPVDPSARHELTLYMEDTAWPHEGKLDAYLQAAHDHYAPSLAEGRHGEGKAILTLDGVFQTAYGSGKRAEVLLWQKVIRPNRLANLLQVEVPEQYRVPGTWMHDALQVRDDWESRLLRTSSWSPIW